MISLIKRYATPWRVLLAFFFGLCAVIAFLRFYKGLGAVTNLSNEQPWGIWVGFDILAGIGLAAGGFVMAACVYVFHMDKYKPLVRMAILTALLGYVIFVVGLMLEIGRPWNMWRVFTNPNIHSPLWEIAICVVTYTTVLFLEFSQVVFEKLGWKGAQEAFHKISVGLVIVGVLLSTLHQSTLGTLFTIVPHKLHALWYSPILPVHFFVSCVAAGMAMVTFESFLSWRFLKHPPRVDLLTGLVRVMVVVLIIYFVIRVEDLAVRGSLIEAFKPGFPALLFWLENLFFVFIPLGIIFRSPGHVMSSKALFFTSLFTVLGFIMHRFNVAVSGWQFIEPTGYFPSWMEITISIGLVAAAFVAAALAVNFLPVHHHEKIPAIEEKGGVFRVRLDTPASE